MISECSVKNWEHYKVQDFDVALFKYHFLDGYNNFFFTSNIVGRNKLICGNDFNNCYANQK